MKKKPFILILAALGVLAAGVWAFSRPEKDIVVKGNVSAQEVREIKQAVIGAMRKEVFPGFSWSNLKAFPSRARWYLRHDVRRITVDHVHHAQALVAAFSGTNSFSEEIYWVVKGTNGWIARPALLQYDGILN